MTKKVPAQTKSQQAYYILRDMIVTGQFNAENNWSLRKLAAKLEMSVVPITEALRRLEQEGIIDVRPQRGITVKQLSIQELEELKLMREGIEVQAGRMVAIHQPKEAIAEIQRIAQSIYEYSKASNHTEMVLADLHMHQAIVKASDCPLLIERHDQLITMSMLSHGGPWDSRNWITHELMGSGNHIALGKAFESKDPDIVDRAIRDHIKSCVDRKRAK